MLIGIYAVSHMQSVKHECAECRYAECRYAECRGTSGRAGETFKR